jgi:hypothetical protein
MFDEVLELINSCRIGSTFMAVGGIEYIWDVLVMCG